MATYQISPPESFDFTKSEDWPNWIRQFERFRVASDLCSKTGANQVNTLVYSMGDKADDILRSFKLSADQEKVYKTVKDEFDKYFVKRRNIIYESSIQHASSRRRRNCS